MVTGQVQTGISKAKPQHFAMVKNFGGSMTVLLEAHDFSTPARPFKFKFSEERKSIPVKWAVGVFVSQGALRQMELGYFTFENLEGLIKMAEDMGHYVPDSIKEPKITVKEIKKILKGSDKKEIERLLMNVTPKVRNDIIMAARAMHNQLSQEVIKTLQDKLKVSLAVVEDE